MLLWRALDLGSFFFFFFNDPAPTEISPLPLHDALPIYPRPRVRVLEPLRRRGLRPFHGRGERDRKSTRLNSSHSQISYAVFCLKKKKNNSTHSSKRQEQPHYHGVDYTLLTQSHVVLAPH